MHLQAEAAAREEEIARLELQLQQMKQQQQLDNIERMLTPGKAEQQDERRKSM